EQRRILAELTKRHGKPEQVVERNIRLTASGPKHAYLMARWDLPGGEVCFHGVLPPEKNAKEPARQGRIYYSSRSLRGTTNCILSLESAPCFRPPPASTDFHVRRPGSAVAA